jgi:hypothetical protein
VAHLAHQHRYLIEFLDEPVAEVGSIAGLEAAVLEHGMVTISLAYPRDATWLDGWASQPSRRQLLVRDRVRKRTITLDALGIRDASGDSLIFELSIVEAKVLGRAVTR